MRYKLLDRSGPRVCALAPAQQDRLDRAGAVERGFPYDFVTGGRDSFTGPVTNLVDDHRHTVV